MEHADLVKALNEDLTREYQAVIMYTAYSAMVTGPWRQNLVSFMQGEIPDELAHAQFLADKIAALGGQPATNAAPVPPAETALEMLQNILKAEAEAVQNYTQRARQAEEAGDKALAVQLENMILDEQNHHDETAKLIDGWQ